MIKIRNAGLNGRLVTKKLINRTLMISYSKCPIFIFFVSK
jgi:hypothetical protein